MTPRTPGASVVLFSAGSPIAEDLRAALSKAGLTVRVARRREEVRGVPAPYAVVVDLLGFPDPWNDVRRLGTDQGLAGAPLFVCAEAANGEGANGRPERLARFARMVAESLGLAG